MTKLKLLKDMGLLKPYLKEKLNYPKEMVQKLHKHNFEDYSYKNDECASFGMDHSLSNMDHCCLYIAPLKTLKLIEIDHYKDAKDVGAKYVFYITDLDNYWLDIDDAIKAYIPQYLKYLKEC